MPSIPTQPSTASGRNQRQAAETADLSAIIGRAVAFELRPTSDAILELISLLRRQSEYRSPLEGCVTRTQSDTIEPAAGTGVMASTINQCNPQPSEVQLAFMQLDDTIGNLYALVDRLTDAIMPVLAPDLPYVTGAGAPQQNKPSGDRPVAVLTNKVESVTDSLRQIRSRLEILNDGVRL